MHNYLLVPLRGRLGNQLFEYSFARAIQLEFDIIPILSTQPLKQLQIENRLLEFNIPDFVKFVDEIQVSVLQKIGLLFYNKFANLQNLQKRFDHEKKFQKLYQKLGLFMCHDGYLKIMSDVKKINTICNGYFQSEKFFYKYKDTILNDLTFSENVKSSCISYEEIIKSSINPVCLHIRLGDYVKHPFHGVADIHYYIKAINKIREIKPDSTLFVFSDNIELVKGQLHNISNSEYIPSELSDHQTLYLGSLCNDYIISNSSFSWWMQYLSNKKDRIVIAPSRWYAKPCPCEIYQDNWFLIEV